MKKIQYLFLASSCIGSIGLPSTVQAQTEAKPNAEEANVHDGDIVVTGTLIRGTRVTGSQTISVGVQDIQAKAATTTNELLGTIPQISNTFNGRFEGDPRGIAAGISINKPNLRSLPSSNSTSGGLTLVMVDSMRMTPVGVNQSSIDVDIIPAAVIAGIDAVTDGGSSLYGADAVAGVLNFRTLRRFEGIKVDGNYGFGTRIKGYQAWDAAVTAGKSWDSGNAYVSVGRYERDGILNGETPWADGTVYDAAGVAGKSFTQCPNPVGTETRWYRFGAGAAQFTNNPSAPGAGVFPVGTPCDNVVGNTYLPQQTRTNVYGQLSQVLGDDLDLRVTAYWTKRDTVLENFPRGFTAAGSPLTTGGLVGAAFPTAAVRSLTAVPGGTSFSFGVNPNYVNTPAKLGFQTWGVSPEVNWKFGKEWELRTSAHFGRSTNYQSFPNVDQLKAQCYITGCTGIAAGQLDPFNAAAASAAVIQDITNYTNAQDTNQRMFVLRTVADGPLFALPGGDAKVAVGAEYQFNWAETRLLAGPFGALDALPFRKSSRNAKSVFAEVSLPVTDFADVSGSVRYDSYSDFGSTTNPNVGLTLKPTSWLKIFGHWNTSFNAPTAVDGLAISTGRFSCGIYVAGSTNPSQRPNDPLGRDTSKQGTCALVLEGAGPGLKPQTAHSWAVGFEATPAVGVRLSANFFSIDLKNALGNLNPSNTNTYTTNPDLYTYNISATQYAALLATLVNGPALGAQRVASDIGIVTDRRTSNLNAAKLEGVDFQLNLDKPTDLGRFGLGLNGTYRTRALITAGGVTQTELAQGSRLRAATYVAWNKGPVSTRMTLNYSGAGLDEGFNYLGVRERLRPFMMTNLNLGYDFAGTKGPMGGLSVRVTVDNLFDVQPQRIRRANTNNPTFARWTLGRVIKLGASFKM